MVTASATRRLGLAVVRHRTRVSGLGNVDVSVSSGHTALVFQHAGDPRLLHARALIVPQIAAKLPQDVLPFTSWHSLAKLDLADPAYHTPAPIEILLGADILPAIIRTGRVQAARGAPAAFETSLGWVIMGPYSSSSPPVAKRRVTFAPHTVFFERSPAPAFRKRTTLAPSTERSTAPSTADAQDPVANVLPSSVNATAMTALEPLTSEVDNDPPLIELVRQLWELDRVSDSLPLTPDEQRCEDNYTNSTYRLPTGRYVVSLPLRDSALGSSFNAARGQFLRLEKRLDANPVLKGAYHAVIQDYLNQGHLVRVSPSHQPSYQPYYLPHHPVHRIDDPPTKVRVVFNASCKSSNDKSLNDILFVGKKLQADILVLLSRFRLHQFVFTADIQQMYRQVRLAPAHHDYQRILWRFSSAEAISVYHLTTVTFGVSSAPFLALRTLQQLALDEELRFPLAARSLKSDVYVDDFLTGCHSLDSALLLRRQLQDLLLSGGFELRKWASNRPELLEDLPADHCRVVPSLAAAPLSEPFSLDRDPVIKVLGLDGDPKNDHFFYAARLSVEPPTKRAILRQIARIFDPPGWLSPTIFTGKLFFRHLCDQGLEWDQPLPPDLASTWSEYYRQLALIADIAIPRYFAHAGTSSEFHLVGFCDASEVGYAAVVYLHSRDPDGQITSSLVAAKSKVAPLKRVSLPRLELCGAHLLAKLVKFLLARVFCSVAVTTIAFCDSTVALAWIRGQSNRWKTFVGNRVAEIQEIIPPPNWCHVSSTDNPADCASRGISATHLINHPLWWTGPSWLMGPATSWSSHSLPYSAPEDVVSSEAKTPATIMLLNAPSVLPLEERFSSLNKLIRVTAWCRRFSNNWLQPHQTLRGPLSSAELREALLCTIRRTQRRSLAMEREDAMDSQTRSRMVRQLRLFVDSDDLLRVGGRLEAAALLTDHRQPLLLPKVHPLTSLVIDDAHIRNLHAGALSTHAYIRRTFWIPDGRNIVRRKLASCNRCFAVKPRAIIQPMGNLPPDRVAATSAFRVTGVDYAGPFAITSARIRGAATTKAYLVVFICFASKAVHFELASDLSTAAFIAAFRRFASRRGYPSAVFSDKGTNFAGAARELRKLLVQEGHQCAIVNAAATNGTDWRFIPPSSPHFGGIWEAAVKSAKYHLRRVLGAQLLNYEEMLTLATQIEAILNSRPLCPVSADPADLSALTPGHFLVFRPITAPPNPSLVDVPLPRLSRWQLVQRLQQDFWKRWRNEYLHTLQQRAAWLRPPTAVTPGTMVIVKDDIKPPSQWALGRITSVHPGPDDVVRVVDVRTPAGVLRRPCAKLCPLPSQ